MTLNSAPPASSSSVLGLQTCTKRADLAVQGIRLRVLCMLEKHHPFSFGLSILINQEGTCALASMNACLKTPFFAQQKTWLKLLSNPQSKGVRLEDKLCSLLPRTHRPLFSFRLKRRHSHALLPLSLPRPLTLPVCRLCPNRPLSFLWACPVLSDPIPGLYEGLSSMKRGYRRRQGTETKDST